MELQYVVVKQLTVILLACTCRFAYIEFADKESVDTAVTMDDSLFKGRQIKVCALYTTELKNIL